jgi:hypothetical protein
MHVPTVIESLIKDKTSYELGENILKLMWENSELKHELHYGKTCYFCKHFIFFDDENGKGYFGNCCYHGFGEYINEAEFNTLVCNKYDWKPQHEALKKFVIDKDKNKEKI